jgi:hypothetical protein
MSKIDFEVPYQIPQCRAEFPGCLELKSEPRFVIFAKFYHRNMCTMSKINFGVPYQIPERRAEFPGCLELKSEHRFVIFVKFYHGNMCIMSKMDFGCPTKSQSVAGSSLGA